MKTDPKKKSIPKVLRPTITMPESDWNEVWFALQEHAMNELRTLVRLGHPDNEYLRGKLEEIKKLTRLADYIKGAVKNYCEAIRNPEDDDLPY